MILRSFQRKGLCDSSLKAKSTTFVRNITTIRLRSQFVISNGRGGNRYSTYAFTEQGVGLCLVVFFVHKQLLRLIFGNNKELTCKDRIVYENIEYSHIKERRDNT